MFVNTILDQKGRDVITVTPSASIREAVKLLAARRIGAVLVREDGAANAAGILSERDIVRGLAEKGPALLERPVSEMMTRDLFTCAPADSIDQVMDVMTKRRIRHLPVTDRGRLIGMISIGDVVKFRMAEIEREAEDLRQYIAS
ncbi:MAG: CBS domain-containing protein [Alphaproteobacteria bacterium]|nr:CBS domain-containing protein [Alphaproteobacteria bacterium]